MVRRLLVDAHHSNIHDHLSNHAVIHDATHWMLSPVPGLGPQQMPDAAFAANPRFGLAAGDTAAIRDAVRGAVARTPDFMDVREVPPRIRPLLLPPIDLGADAAGRRKAWDRAGQADAWADTGVIPAAPASLGNSGE